MTGTFCTVGNLKKPFERFFNLIFESIDLLPKPIIIQSGYNNINTSNLYNVKKFFNIEEHEHNILNSHVVISHGGAGTIFQCLQNNKIPIIIPRISSKNEHINDHQIDLFKKLNSLNLIYAANSRDDFNNLFKKNNFIQEKIIKSDPLIDIVTNQILNLINEK